MAAPNIVGLGTISTAIVASAVKESQLRQYKRPRFGLASQWKDGTRGRTFSQKSICCVCAPSLPPAPPGSLPNREMLCRKFPRILQHEMPRIHEVDQKPPS